MKQNLKKYSIKNYKGNLLESLDNFLKKYKDAHVVKIVEDSGNLSIFAEDKQISEEMGSDKFEVGCKYSWWSKNPQWTDDEFVIVEIAPDRSYALIVPVKNEDLRAEKFKITVDERFGEKLVDHPASYTWRIARADKGGTYVGVPEGWYSGETARRKKGASAASETRRIKSVLDNLRKKLTKEHFYKLKAAVLKNRFDSWEDMQKYWQENGWDKELVKYNPPDKIRMNGKIAYQIFFGPKDASPFEICFDGEKFYDGYDKLSDEEIREILSDIL